MPSTRKIRRYAAYFRGWATAFGAHEKDVDEERGLIWLFGEDQLGLILTPAMKRFLFPLFLGRSRGGSPSVRLGPASLSIEDVEMPVGDRDRRALDALKDLMRPAGDLHLFQPYRLASPSGTRILTLGRRPPLPLVYREIAPMVVEIV